MPKVPMDFANTIIYKIVCNDLNIPECYVGHTTNFIQRRNKHKTNCVNEKGKHYNYKLYKNIRENGGWANYSMIELEKYPCNDANEACAKEREYYDKLNSSLNSINPHRNKEEIAASCRKYYVNNKEKIIAYCRENKEKFAEYYKINKEKISEKKQEYGKINKMKIAARNQKYRENNKEKISVIKKCIYICECGKEISYGHKDRHFKSKVHNDFFLVK